MMSSQTIAEDSKKGGNYKAIQPISPSISFLHHTPDGALFVSLIRLGPASLSMA
jgi:hypothetical protein